MLPVDTVRLRAVLAALRQIHEVRTQGDWGIEGEEISTVEGGLPIGTCLDWGAYPGEPESNARSIAASVNLDMEMIQMVEELLAIHENFSVGHVAHSIADNILTKYLARATVVLQGLGVEM